MDKKIVKMKLVNWVDFETPISIDETKSLHDDFMFKVDEVFCDSLLVVSFTHPSYILEEMPSSLSPKRR